MHLNGYEVWITCDGEPLPEYQAQVEGDGKTVACFIPSESGKASSHYIQLHKFWDSFWQHGRPLLAYIAHLAIPVYVC